MPFNYNHRLGVSTAVVSALSLSTGLALAKAPQGTDAAPKPAVSVAPDAAAPTAKDILAKMAAKYKGITSYTSEGSLAVKNAENSVEFTDKVAFKNGKAAVTVTTPEGTSTRIFDGKAVFVTKSTEPKAYQKLAAKTPQAGVSAALSQADIGLLPLLLTDPDVAGKILPSNTTTATVDPKGVTVDGVVVDVVNASMGEGKGSFRFDIGKEDGLLRRIVISQTKGCVEASSLIATYRNIKINPVLQDSQFVFTPAPGQVAQEAPAEQVAESRIDTPATTESEKLYHYKELPSSFFYAPKQVAEYVTEGLKLAEKKKTFADVLKKYKSDLKVARGSKGTASGEVVCFGLKGNHLTVNAYNAAANYVKDSPSSQTLENGGFPKRLIFDVVMVSQPKVGETRDSYEARIGTAINNVSAAYSGNEASVVPPAQIQVLKNADPREVKVTRFVMSDDLGNNYEAESEVTEARNGQETVYGQAAQSVTVQGESRANAQADASVGGTYATARVATRERSTFRITEAVPFTQQHPYFVYRYEVQFPLFDANGKSRIPSNAKKIIIRCLTESGELNAEFKL